MYISKDDIIETLDQVIRIIALDCSCHCYIVEIDGEIQRISYWDDIWKNIIKIKKKEEEKA